MYWKMIHETVNYSRKLSAGEAQSFYRWRNICRFTAVIHVTNEKVTSIIENTGRKTEDAWCQSEAQDRPSVFAPARCTRWGTDRSRDHTKRKTRKYSYISINVSLIITGTYEIKWIFVSIIQWMITGNLALTRTHQWWNLSKGHKIYGIWPSWNACTPPCWPSWGSAGHHLDIREGLLWSPAGWRCGQGAGEARKQH